MDLVKERTSRASRISRQSGDHLEPRRRPDYEEGCLSIPEYYAEVERPASVRVRYLDRDGKLRELDAEGLMATCIQHEIDHLNGVLFIDHISQAEARPRGQEIQARRPRRWQAVSAVCACGSSSWARRISPWRRSSGWSSRAMRWPASIPSRRSRPAAGWGRGRRRCSARRSAGHRGAHPRLAQAPSRQAAFAGPRRRPRVVVAYGLILPRRCSRRRGSAAYNIHASLLPRWRGAAPIQRAIMAGDAETGIVVMRMEEGLDTGPVCLPSGWRSRRA